mmetsp:Transcript_33469/g.73143  ORF Transcript_33469/g.73143 Transcript_33469/m.73143 type:complete len:204 (+) Transcript_33469:274-885(+)
MKPLLGEPEHSVQQLEHPIVVVEPQQRPQHWGGDLHRVAPRRHQQSQSLGLDAEANKDKGLANQLIEVECQQKLEDILLGGHSVLHGPRQHPQHRGIREGGDDRHRDRWRRVNLHATDHTSGVQHHRRQPIEHPPMHKSRPVQKNIQLAQLQPPITMAHSLHGLPDAGCCGGRGFLGLLDALRGAVAHRLDTLLQVPCGPQER